jgi:hypothetical protein
MQNLATTVKLWVAMQDQGRARANCCLHIYARAIESSSKGSNVMTVVNWLMNGASIAV